MTTTDRAGPPDLTWQAPLPRVKAAMFVAELKKRPGDWAIYPGAQTRAAAQHLRTRYGLQAVVRTEHGDRRVYARWTQDQEVPT